MSAEEMKNKSFFVQKSVKMRKSIELNFKDFCFIFFTQGMKKHIFIQKLSLTVLICTTRSRLNVYQA